MFWAMQATAILAQDERFASRNISVSAVRPGHWYFLEHLVPVCHLLTCEMGWKCACWHLPPHVCVLHPQAPGAHCMQISMQPRQLPESDSSYLCSRTSLNQGQDHAPLSAEEGAGSIAWNVEHKDAAELNGKLWSFGKEGSF